MKLYSFIILGFIALFFFQCTPKNSQQIENQKMGKLVYIMDPQCGWCYGNKDNITAVRDAYKDKLDFELMVGGMWLGENAPMGGEGLSEFMLANGPRMSQTTGVLLGDAFYELSKDSSYAFSSLEPSSAIVLMKEMHPNKAFEFAKEIQEAIYSNGDKLNEWNTYEKILKKMNLEINPFKKNWLSEENLKNAQLEFSKCNGLVSGFPTLLYYKNGTPTLLASGFFNQEEVMTKINELL